MVADFADVLKAYRITKIKGDRYSGEWCREAFRKHGIAYDPADAPKSDLYRDLLPFVNSGKVSLLGNKRLITQLLGLERRTSRAGRDSIDHAPGGHDDLANAAAGALLSAMAKRPRARIGAIDFAGTGRVTWKPHDDEKTRISVVYITEKEDLKRRGLL